MQTDIFNIEMAKNGSKEAREKIVEDNTGLVWSVVRRFWAGARCGDLFRLAASGLLGYTKIRSVL